jgi:hypothetical protein
VAVSVGGAVGAVGGAVVAGVGGPVDTMSLTVLPWSTGVPALGSEVTTIPAGISVLGCRMISAVNPRAVSSVTASASATPRSTGTVTWGTAADVAAVVGAPVVGAVLLGAADVGT